MFKLKEYNTDAKTESLAGITTFLTMMYLVIVNPVLLSSAGVPVVEVVTATI
ncbi:MAG: NCS2 family permease, partial [Priestia megaterium]